MHHSPVAKMAEDSFSTGSVEASVTPRRGGSSGTHDSKSATTSPNMRTWLLTPRRGPLGRSVGQNLLTSFDTFENVALMGWGSGDPEPHPGRWWGSLDDRIDVMGSTGPRKSEDDHPLQAHLGG